jgi:hypothetical protein
MPRTECARVNPNHIESQVSARPNGHAFIGVLRLNADGALRNGVAAQNFFEIGADRVTRHRQTTLCVHPIHAQQNFVDHGRRDMRAETETPEISDQEYKASFYCFQCGAQLTAESDCVECAACGKFLCQGVTPCVFCMCEFTSRMIQ